MYGWPVVGTPETVAPIEMDDIRTPFLSFVRPEYATVMIAGDLTVDEAKSTLDKTLGTWKLMPLNIASPESPAISDAKEMRVIVVDRPDAVQTVIQFLLPGPKFNDQYRVFYRLLNTLFGGSFTSRLNMNRRENTGYTYGARSGFTMRQHVGYVSASSSVRADVTGAALKEFLGEFKRIRGGDVSVEEITKARETYRTDVIQSFAGLNGILGEAFERISGGLHFETLARDMGALSGATTDELNKLASQAFPLEKGVLVLVGDKKLILDQIKDLGLPAPVEMNVRGEKVGS
jgi:predicted Zn-dependent peptidase